MTLQALLLTTDDSASDILGRILPASGVAVERFSNLAVAVSRVQQQKFDALIVDFDDPAAAQEIIREALLVSSPKPPLTVALVAEPSKVREILSAGAHFVLYKPVSRENARAGLRAVTALLNRERRRAFRVPVQAPVELTLPDGRKLEAILLDLSQTGMDMLTAEMQATGSLVGFRFKLPDASVEIEGHGQVAWANANGQTGVHFLDLPMSASEELRTWLQAAATAQAAGQDEMVPHCKLTDLSLGGCYVETNSPFPESALVDLCLKTAEMEIHTEGMVRVTHPGFGMGVEFPSRTLEQREQVGNLISFLQSCRGTNLELQISPKSLTADLSQFEHAQPKAEASGDDMDDLLFELLRRGRNLDQEEFLAELRHQRSSENVTA